MTHDRDFDRIRHSAATSAIAGAGRRLIGVMATAWSTSTIGRWWTGAGRAFARLTAPARVRWWAITIATAAAAHLVLRSFMSSTVAPGMPPALYVLIATASAAIAWQADAFHRAWRDSRLLQFTSFDDGD